MGPLTNSPNTNSTSLSEALFSGVRQRVIGLLFGHTGRSYHGNELVKLAGSGKGALQRELKRLTDSGLVTVAEVGNQKRYQANPQSPVFEDLRSIVEKTFGLADVLAEGLRPIADRISLAIVFGSVAKRSDTARSDIDLLIVSDSASHQEIFKVLEKTEAKLGRKINPTLYTAKEFAKRRAQGNSFVTRILEQPKIYLIGSARDVG